MTLCQPPKHQDYKQELPQHTKLHSPHSASVFPWRQKPCPQSHRHDLYCVVSLHPHPGLGEITQHAQAWSWHRAELRWSSLFDVTDTLSPPFHVPVQAEQPAAAVFKPAGSFRTGFSAGGEGSVLYGKTCAGRPGCPGYLLSGFLSDNGRTVHCSLQPRACWDTHSVISMVRYLLETQAGIHSPVKAREARREIYPQTIMYRP